MVKVCQKCGKYYKSPSTRSKYCSVCIPTVTYYKKKPILTKTCDNAKCAKVFKTNQPSQRFCSEACKKLVSYTKVYKEKICINPTCNKPFLTSTDKRDYCSKVCAYSAKLEREKERARCQKDQTLVAQK